MAYFILLIKERCIPCGASDALCTSTAQCTPAEAAADAATSICVLHTRRESDAELRRLFPKSKAPLAVSAAGIRQRPMCASPAPCTSAGIVLDVSDSSCVL